MKAIKIALINSDCTDLIIINIDNIYDLVKGIRVQAVERLVLINGSVLIGGS